MSQRRCFVTRDPAGYYVMTAGEPVIAPVQGTDRLAVYVPVGDPLRLRHLPIEWIEGLLPEMALVPDCEPVAVLAGLTTELAI